MKEGTSLKREFLMRWTFYFAG
ncbi:hypothetical protein, partial [Bacillus velezensis]